MGAEIFGETRRAVLSDRNRGVVDAISAQRDVCLVSHRLRSVLSHLACIPAGYFRSGPDFGPANGAGSAFQGKEAPPYLGCIPAGYFRPGPAFCPTHGVGPFFQVELQTPIIGGSNHKMTQA